MSAAILPPSDLDELLAALDAADASVRAIYLKLADDPDLAPEYEAGLRELLRKRTELAQQAGVAALVQWRAARLARETPSEMQVGLEQALPDALEPEPPPTPSQVVVATESPLIEEVRPAPTPPPPASDVPAPVSARQLEEFKAAFAAPASTPRVVPKADDRTLLLALARHVTIAEAVATSGAFDQEVEQLERAAAEERQKRWREMGREAQVRWLSLLVAWAKALEEDAFRLHEPNTRVAAAFRTLRTFSIHDNPGYVHGFARTATPKWGGTWRMDALYHLREVRPEPVPALVKPKATTKVKAPLAEEDEDEGPEQELADWPYLDQVKGLRVVLLGGEVREERRVALEQAFQLETLEWVPTDRPRLVASLAERAASGTVDFILVTKFVRHKETAAIERASQVPVLTLRHGYGVTTVRQVFEEYFARPEGKANGKIAKRRSG
jgi:hypothetical protein